MLKNHGTMVPVVVKRRLVSVSAKVLVVFLGVIFLTVVTFDGLLQTTSIREEYLSSEFVRNARPLRKTSPPNFGIKSVQTEVQMPPHTTPIHDTEDETTTMMRLHVPSKTRDSANNFFSTDIRIRVHRKNDGASLRLQPIGTNVPPTNDVSKQKPEDKTTSGSAGLAETRSSSHNSSSETINEANNAASGSARNISGEPSSVNSPSFFISTMKPDESRKTEMPSSLSDTVEPAMSLGETLEPSIMQPTEVPMTRDSTISLDETLEPSSMEPTEFPTTSNSLSSSETAPAIEVLADKTGSMMPTNSNAKQGELHLNQTSNTTTITADDLETNNRTSWDSGSTVKLTTNAAAQINAITAAPLRNETVSQAPAQTAPPSYNTSSVANTTVTSDPKLLASSRAPTKVNSGQRPEAIHVTSAPIDKEEEFCVPWSQSADEWWVHKPDWEMGKENDTHYCFQRIQNVEKRELLVKLHHIQFEGNCSNTLTKRMWSSGWNADFMNVIDGFQHAVLNNRPMQVVDAPWHYADPFGAKPHFAAYKGIQPACKRGTMFCYFLPLSNCPAAPEGDKRVLLEKPFFDTITYQWYYEYATRRQTWLRKFVYDFRKRQAIKTPCTAMHVRRSDVVLHKDQLKRQYFPIKDYMKNSYNVQHNIFLLTDDANAIVEAQKEFPEYNWMYMHRPRFRAFEGGFENQFPSKQPVFEVIMLLAIFEMVKSCNQLIHSESTFATRLIQEMKASGKFPDLKYIKIGDRKNVYSEEHARTVNVSTAYQPIGD
ncbi:expressed unknown protein [Seminavis robusta]|uniref:Uncharacterized protein n=1 Tax=Seminavis robusta TaxID=568900 RepID=A0A9N8HMU6_9STRA|nr:expressed unknown protein [Seminavis robusta]|eukprot:Sro931_g221480.1 n/a (769) ;mRNA; f:29360-31666